MDREKQIQKYMEKLQITRAEAEQLFDDDNSNEVLPEVAEMEKKAKNVKNYVATEKSKKSKTRERKIDERKKIFTDIMAESLIKTGADIKIKSENEYIFGNIDRNFRTYTLDSLEPIKIGEHGEYETGQACYINN